VQARYRHQSDGSAPTDSIEFEPDQGGWIVQENLEWPASVAARLLASEERAVAI
jgi:hypothetical protein